MHRQNDVCYMHKVVKNDTYGFADEAYGQVSEERSLDSGTGFDECKQPHGKVESCF